jgi:hypothetical protein
MQNTAELLQAIKWPAIIKLDGDDELIHVADADQLIGDIALLQMHFREQDRLIDSNGSVYRINNINSLTLTPTEDWMKLEEIEELLQLHLSNQGTCCVAKFHANSVHAAISNVFG